jgi:hypothetical protein
MSAIEASENPHGAANTTSVGTTRGLPLEDDERTAF